MNPKKEVKKTFYIKWIGGYIYPVYTIITENKRYNQINKSEAQKIILAELMKRNRCAENCKRDFWSLTFSIADEHPIIRAELIKLKLLK